MFEKTESSAPEIHKKTNAPLSFSSDHLNAIVVHLAYSYDSRFFFKLDFTAPIETECHNHGLIIFRSSLVQKKFTSSLCFSLFLPFYEIQGGTLGKVSTP